MPLRYPCIFCSNSMHCAPSCPRKIEAQNIFRTKPNITVTITTKNLKLDNILVNVVVVITTYSQALK